jgi:hypothetical protein
MVKGMSEDIVYRIATVPILTDVVLSSVFAGVLGWFYYKPDLKKMWKEAIDGVGKDREKVFGQAQQQLSQGLSTGNVGKVVVGASKSVVAAQSFGPLYALGKLIENAVKR